LPVVGCSPSIGPFVGRWVLSTISVWMSLSVCHTLVDRFGWLVFSLELQPTREQLGELRPASTPHTGTCSWRCDHVAPSRAHAGCGAATASGDAPHDDHTNDGWPGAAVRLGHISCRRDQGCCGPRPLSGRAGCTEKVQCLTGGDASGGTTTLGHGEGSTEGGARPFANHVDTACLANHVDAPSHGR